MSKPKTRCYRLFGKVLKICCVEIKITYEKCDTFKNLRDCYGNLLTRPSPVALDADRKNQEFKKDFA